MDLHWTSWGICPYLPNLWLIVSRRMMVVENAGIKISYWVLSSKSLVDKRRFQQKCPASQHIRKEPTKNDFIFQIVLNWQHKTPSSLTYPYLPNLWLIEEVEHVEICSCGICNCSWWTCIEQVVGFAILMVKFSCFGIVVDGLALNKVAGFVPTSQIFGW